MFRSLYEWVFRLSKHPKASWYLCAVSFAESSFFPIPTALMLAPMCLAQRNRAWRLAMITTISSVAGGVLGYLIGMFFFDTIGQQVIDVYHAQEKFDAAVGWFSEYGVWIVFIAGFSPIPYKLFTLTSGMLGLAVIPFILASLVGRAGQFYLVASLIRFGGEHIEKSLNKYVEWIGWGVVIIGVVVYLLVRS